MFILVWKALKTVFGTFLAFGGSETTYMKKLLLFCTAVFILFSAFKPAAGLDDVISALRSGNAQELSKYIDDNVEIALPDKSNMYSRAQAVMVLQDFFSNSGVKSFEVKHKGDNGGSQFCIGTLNTKAGSFRTTVFMATRNGKQLVKEIRFQAS